jgi:hypothetical protein
MTVTSTRITIGVFIFTIMRLLLFIHLLLVAHACYCQDISGKWTGNFGKNFNNKDVNKLIITLELYNDSLIKGTSRLEYESNKYEYYVIKGVYHKQDSTIYFSEDKEIDVNMGVLAPTVMGNYTMKLRVYDTIMRFEGKWRENGEGLLAQMASRVYLQKGIKKNEPAQVVATPSYTELAKIKDKQSVKTKERETIIQRQIDIDTVEQDSIRIDIIDNARIDNDVISLYLDDSLLIHKQTISKDPITLYIFLDRYHTFRSLRLVAESYGSMPPCTAHIKVSTCQSIHTFDLRSTYQYDAMIEFYLKGTRKVNPPVR